jgi:hypothetical protein
MSCQSKQPQKINIFLRGKQNAIFIFFPARPCVCAVGERVVLCLSCRVSSSTRHPWVSPGENTTRGSFEKKQKNLKKSCVGFFLFLRFGGGGGGERLIEFRKRIKKERERRRKKKERDGAPWRTCLIDRPFPSRLFSLFFHRRERPRSLSYSI